MSGRRLLLEPRWRQYFFGWLGQRQYDWYLEPPFYLEREGAENRPDGYLSPLLPFRFLSIMMVLMEVSLANIYFGAQRSWESLSIFIWASTSLHTVPHSLFLMPLLLPQRDSTSSNPPPSIQDEGRCCLYAPQNLRKGRIFRQNNFCDRCHLCLKILCREASGGSGSQKFFMVRNLKLCVRSTSTLGTAGRNTHLLLYLESNLGS